MNKLQQQFKTPLGYISLAIAALAILGLLNMFTGVFIPATLCPIEQKTCSPLESIQYIQRDTLTGTGFTLETFDSLFLRQAESVLLETSKSEDMKGFESQFRAYLSSRQSTFTGSGSVLPYAKDFLTKGSITNLELEYFTLAMDNAIKNELKNFLVKNEASLIATYEKQYAQKLPLVFDPASSIRLFEQLQGTYTGNGQLFIVENMSRASEVQQGESYDYVDWTATIRTSVPFLNRFLEDLESAQSLKENTNSRLNLPFFILQKAKIVFLNAPGSGSGQLMEEINPEVRAEIVLRMYLSKITEKELGTKRDEVQKQLDQAKELREQGRQVSPTNIAKYDQLVLLGNERVRLYRDALRANNLRVAYNELTTLQEIYTELLTYFS